MSVRLDPKSGWSINDGNMPRCIDNAMLAQVVAIQYLLVGGRVKQVGISKVPPPPSRTSFSVRRPLSKAHNFKKEEKGRYKCVCVCARACVCQVINSSHAQTPTPHPRFVQPITGRWVAAESVQPIPAYSQVTYTSDERPTAEAASFRFPGGAGGATRAKARWTSRQYLLGVVDLRGTGCETRVDGTHLLRVGAPSTSKKRWCTVAKEQPTSLCCSQQNDRRTTLYSTCCATQRQAAFPNHTTTPHHTTPHHTTPHHTTPHHTTPHHTTPHHTTPHHTTPHHTTPHHTTPHHTTPHQWAVDLLQHTASLPGGSGQWNSCNTPPHCLGAVGGGPSAIHCPTAWGTVGSGPPATHCLTAWGQWAVQLLQYTASPPEGSGQWTPCNTLPTAPRQ